MKHLMVAVLIIALCFISACSTIPQCAQHYGWSSVTHVCEPLGHDVRDVMDS
jgi:starvation-inducible outer membrane lipoprotein